MALTVIPLRSQVVWELECSIPKNAGDSNKKDVGQTETGNGPGLTTTPTISLPKSGAIRGMGEKFAATLVSGTGSMSVPIATSVGETRTIAKSSHSISHTSPLTVS